MSARILVVDDLLPNVRLLEAKLTSEYFEVLTASDGPTALEIIEKHPPDIVLLDVMMPGMDGPTTYNSIRDMTDFEAVPIIFMTAKVMESDQDLYRSLGAAGIIAKPFDPMTLPDQIREIWVEHHE